MDYFTNKKSIRLNNFKNEKLFKIWITKIFPLIKIIESIHLRRISYLDHYPIDMLFIFQESHPFRVSENLSFVSVLFPSIIPKQYLFVYLHLSG